MRRRGGLLARLKALFFPGPWRYIFKEEPPPPRFHPGEHMHGLETRDFDPPPPAGKHDTGPDDPLGPPSRPPPGP